MGNKRPYQQPSLIILAGTVVSLFLATMYIYTRADLPLLLLIILVSIVAIVAVITFAYNWVTENHGIFDAQPTNATLTCSNGHKVRVWVNFDGTGFIIDPNKGIYEEHVGGRPRVEPDRCPECGAQWLVPDKHKTRKP